MPSLDPGTPVLVSGLQARPELNGLCGEVGHFVAKAGRYSVKVVLAGVVKSFGLKADNLTKASLLELGLPPAIDASYLPTKKLPPNQACEMCGVSEESAQQLLVRRERDPDSLREDEKRFLSAYDMASFKQLRRQKLEEEEPLACGDPLLVEDGATALFGDEEEGYGDEWKVGGRCRYQFEKRKPLESAVVDKELQLEARRDVCELLLRIVEDDEQGRGFPFPFNSEPAKAKAEVQRIIDITEGEIHKLHESEASGEWLYGVRKNTSEESVDQPYYWQQKNTPPDIGVYLCYCSAVDRKLLFSAGRNMWCDDFGMQKLVNGMRTFGKEFVLAYEEACSSTDAGTTDVVGAMGEQGEEEGKEREGPSVGEALASSGLGLRQRLMSGAPSGLEGEKINFRARMVYAKKVWNGMLKIYLHHAHERNNGGDIKSGVTKAVAFARKAYGWA